jgi:hypothetical protein
MLLVPIITAVLLASYALINSRGILPILPSTMVYIASLRCTGAAATTLTWGGGLVIVS